MLQRNEHPVANRRKVHQVKKMWEDDFSVIDTGGSEENLRVLPIGDEPMTLWLLVQMLYHWATGDPWELRPLN